MLALTTTELTYGLAFFAVTLLVYGIVELLLSLRNSSAKKIERRLQDDLGFSSHDGRPEEGMLVRDVESEKKSAMARWLVASERGASFKKLCYQAAVPWSAHHVLIAIAGTILGVMIFGLLLKVHPITIGSIVVCVMILPVAIIFIRRSARMKKINLQMPEVLELLAQSLRAGHSLQAGIELVAEQMPDPVGTEFSRVYTEQDLGVKLEEAMEHLAERIDLMDMRMFVTAVQIQRQTGGDLTEIMDKIGNVIRDRITILGQVRALTAEGRLSGWVLTALPIGLFMVLFHINPDYPRPLLATQFGNYMLVLAVIMQVIGMLMIRSIVNIKI